MHKLFYRVAQFAGSIYATFAAMLQEMFFELEDVLVDGFDTEESKTVSPDIRLHLQGQGQKGYDPD